MKTLPALIVLALTLAHSVQVFAQPVDVPKTNPMPVYMHYMPWFDTPEVLGPGQWGIHWRMANKNPNIIDANGRRQIASHYYPQIGTYDSRDPHVIEYHMLLMKLAGVDGVLIDWYGVQGTNGDIGLLLENSNAVVNQIGDYGLDFGVVLEDRFSAHIGHAKANVAYLRDHYFNQPEYIRMGPNDDPLLMVFGPITFEQPHQWTEILAEAGEDVNFLTLWYESHEAGANAAGEYAWPWEDAGQGNHLAHIANFYQSRARQLDMAGGIAFPGFVDFYEEGGWGNVVPFEIPHNDGQTLAAMLDLAAQYSHRMDFLQLATWNDFGEGTMFEPTVETGYDYLVQLQEFTGSPFGVDDLHLVYRLFMARKGNLADLGIQSQLDQVASLMAGLEIDDARLILDMLAPEADFDGDGIIDGSDFLLWQRQLGTTGLFPLAIQEGDGNGDGVVDGADLSLWENSFGAALPHLTAKSVTVPEPTTAALLTSIAVFFGSYRRLSRRPCARLPRAET